MVGKRCRPVTGAAKRRRFKAWPAAVRRDLLRYGVAMAGDVRITRLDNGAAVELPPPRAGRAAPTWLTELMRRGARRHQAWATAERRLRRGLAGTGWDDPDRPCRRPGVDRHRRLEPSRDEAQHPLSDLHLGFGARMAGQRCPTWWCSPATGARARRSAWALVSWTNRLLYVPHAHEFYGSGTTAGWRSCSGLGGHACRCSISTRCTSTACASRCHLVDRLRVVRRAATCGVTSRSAARTMRDQPHPHPRGRRRAVHARRCGGAIFQRHAARLQRELAQRARGRDGGDHPSRSRRGIASTRASVDSLLNARSGLRR